MFALLACHPADRMVRSFDSGTRIIGEKEGSQLIQYLNIDGNRPLLILTSLTYDNGGYLAVCAVSNLLWKDDLSPTLWESFNTEGTSMTLTPKESGYPVTLKPSFMPIRYQHLAPGETVSLKDTGARTANCITTNQAWRQEFAKVTVKINLMRKRSMAQ